MKTNQIKKFLRMAWLLMVPVLFFVACSDDEDDPIPPILVEDGYYIVGEVSPFAELSTDGLMMAGINEADDQSPRAGLYEKYVPLRAGAAGFNIVKVSGQTTTDHGPSGMQNVATEGEREQPNITVQAGTLGTSGVFTVPSDGLYHVIIDEQTSKVVIAPVPFWAIIGGATEMGWSDTELPLVGGFNQDEMTFQKEGIVLRAGDFKFRYGGGWKLEIDGEEVKVNTNMGGAVQGELPELTTTMERGGENYAIGKESEGLYTVTVKWSIEDGYTSSLLKTADVDPLDYPETLYMIGSALEPEDNDSDGTPDGWQWDLMDHPLVPVHSKPHLFWKIVWLHEGGEFKFAPQREWAGDFGRTGDAQDGIFARGGDNLPVPGASGYYMVVVNFETEQIAVVEPQVYLIGDAVGSWDGADPDHKFTVDNENQVLTITRTLAAANLRMHAWFDAADGWFTDWWQSEFNIFDGDILFRGTGGDQDAVPVSAGSTKIDLNFRTGKGSITPQ